jgi:phage tail protein X
MTFQFSQGIPRNINNLCFQALTIGFGTQRKKIDGEIMREVLADLELTPWMTRPSNEAQIPAPEAPRFYLGDFSEPQSERARSGIGLAFFAFMVVPLLLILLFTDPGVALEETIRGIVSNDGPVTTLPVPQSLQLPRPPAIATEKPVAVHSELKQVAAGPSDSDSNTTLEPADTHEADDDQASGSSLVRATGRQNLFDIAREYFGQSNWEIIETIRELNPGIGEPDETIRNGKLIRIPAKHPTRVLSAANRGGRITAGQASVLQSNEVELQYPQTTFAIAEQYYGKWTWSIVEQIRSLNPRIHEPSDPIPAGTRIILPDRPSLHSSERGPTSSENPQ